MRKTLLLFAIFAMLASCEKATFDENMSNSTQGHSGSNIEESGVPTPTLSILRNTMTISVKPVKIAIIPPEIIGGPYRYILHGVQIDASVVNACSKDYTINAKLVAVDAEDTALNRVGQKDFTITIPKGQTHASIFISSYEITESSYWTRNGCIYVRNGLYAIRSMPSAIFPSYGVSPKFAGKIIYKPMSLLRGNLIYPLSPLVYNSMTFICKICGKGDCGGHLIKFCKICGEEDCIHQLNTELDLPLK